jgi:signal transduction histidine kinase
VVLGAEREDGFVRITVDDRGPGIPRAERERVFEPYERLMRDESSERTGSGLGLAVVEYIASASGGRVWLDDSPQGGTRAVLELPA